MQKFVTLLLASMLLLSLISCADVNPPTPQGTESIASETTGVPETEAESTDSESSANVPETNMDETTAVPDETTPIVETEEVIGTEEIPHIFDAPPAKQFDVLEVGGELSTLGYIDRKNHISDVYLYPTDRYTDPNSEPRKVVMFLGRIYEVTYQSSQKTYLYGSDVDCYQYADNKITLTVQFDRQTGSIRDLQYFDSGYQDTQNTDDVLSQEECYAKALEFLSSLVDASGYELTDKTAGPSGGFGGLCTFWFTRFISGVKTSNQVRISVTFYGDVIAYCLFSPEPLDSSKLPDEGKLDELSQKVKDRWSSIHIDLPDDLEFLSYEVSELELLRLFDGRYALLYTIKADFLEKHESHSHTLHELAQFLVYLE